MSPHYLVPAYFTWFWTTLSYPANYPMLHPIVCLIFARNSVIVIVQPNRKIPKNSLWHTVSNRTIVLFWRLCRGRGFGAFLALVSSSWFWCIFGGRRNIARLRRRACRVRSTDWQDRPITVIWSLPSLKGKWRKKSSSKQRAARCLGSTLGRAFWTFLEVSKRKSRAFWSFLEFFGGEQKKKLSGQSSGLVHISISIRNPDSGWGRVDQCQETSTESMVSDLTLNSSWRYAQDIRQCPRLSISIIFVLRNRERTMLSSVPSVREWRNIRALKFLQKKGIGEYVSVGEFDGTQSIKSCFEVFFERLFLACWSMISVCLSLFQIKKSINQREAEADQ